MAEDGIVASNVYGTPEATPSKTSTESTRRDKDETRLSQRPTYARSADTTDMLRMANHPSEHDAVLEHYFVGPRDLERHSKLPYFCRVHGSVLPKMIVALVLIGGWATAITVISKYVYELGISSLLLTILGFLVGLSLSFINSTAYERYSDGRKAWASLSLQSRNLARLTWVHIKERPELAKEDLLAKVSALNLILAFAVSLKHRLRFEPHVHYEDLQHLVAHLDTFAAEAAEPQQDGSHEQRPRKTSVWKRAGEWLGLPFAMSNPRKEMKRANKPLGNLPFEIMTHLSAYYEEAESSKILSSAVVYGQILGHMSAMIDVLTQTERVLTTPLPEAYSIVISQITLLYVMTLPFQLFGSLGWITIPGTLAAAYIILGIAAIGHEIENPFGNDVNDLPLDAYCKELGQELDVMMARSAATTRPERWVGGERNLVLWPLSRSGAALWAGRGEQDIRDALKAKCTIGRRLPKH